MPDLSRRKFLTAALFVAAAPIIVRASNLMALPVRPKPKALTVDGFLISGYSETGEWIEEFVPGSYNPSQQTVKRFREVNSITSGPGSVLITPDFHLKERLGTFSLTSLPLDTPRRIIIS